MALQYRCFDIPAKDSRTAEDEISHFLKTIKTINVHRELVPDAGNSYWSIMVEYQEPEKNKASGDKNKSKPKIDYREVLSSEDFAVYAKIRQWRKETAEKEGLQVYNIFYNEQMANIVTGKVMKKAGLKKKNCFSFFPCCSTPIIKNPEKACPSAT